ncbi:MAG: tRNA (adenosine(37)-N6)-dimethylallyltransferase MiaA [Acidobacteria bacterium]|nr:tRNA (adenosine(37)-N6)-dimethylallyltransferase MiaA [Acidobacteriota bacterium]
MKNLLVILGPTASGKTRLGVELARLSGAEILSVDSRQVYRGLDIGSGKDLDEYVVDGIEVPYHLIDIVDLDVEFSVFDFQKRFFQAFESLQQRGVPAIAVGGSGFYLESVLKAYRMVDVPRDQDLRSDLQAFSLQELRMRLEKLRPVHNITDLEDRDRLIRAIEIADYTARHEPEPAPEIDPLVLGVRWDRAVLRRRILDRLSTRLRGGLIEEVEHLHSSGVPWEKLFFLGLEYRFVSQYLKGEIRNSNDLTQKLHSAICTFAKKQETWFRRMERRGMFICWIDEGEISEAHRVIEANGGFAGFGRST